jgi:hypothetical protein
MANEPIASERESGEWTEGGRATGEPAPDMADFSAGAGLMLAALGRMEAAVRADRVALLRLRKALRGLAACIARAKAALPPDRSADAAAGDTARELAILLDEIEHRVDAMIETAGVDARANEMRGAGGEAAEQAGVPTVSDVVSRLGRGQDEEDDVAADAGAETLARGAQVPTVSMLQAMVEALGASPQEAEAETATPSGSDVDSTAPSAEPAPEAIPPDVIDLERALLDNLSRIEAVPLPQDEIGTAVIFPTAAKENGAAEGESNLDPAAFLFEPDTASPAAPAPAESAADPAPPDGSMRHADAAARQADDASTPADIPLPTPVESQDATAAAPPANVEPLGEAATAPPPEQAASEFAAAPSEPAQPAAAAPAADPLAPLKALSAAERLALFS